jgi:phage anti-repressor protein
MKDYALTIDTAKEISMLQRTGKGKKEEGILLNVENKPRTHEATKSEMALLIENEALKPDNRENEPPFRIWI